MLELKHCSASEKKCWTLNFNFFWAFPDQIKSELKIELPIKTMSRKFFIDGNFWMRGVKYRCFSPLWNNCSYVIPAAKALNHDESFYSSHPPSFCAAFKHYIFLPILAPRMGWHDCGQPNKGKKRTTTTDRKRAGLVGWLEKISPSKNNR